MAQAALFGAARFSIILPVIFRLKTYRYLVTVNIPAVKLIPPVDIIPSQLPSKEWPRCGYRVTSRHAIRQRPIMVTWCLCVGAEKSSNSTEKQQLRSKGANEPVSAHFQSTRCQLLKTNARIIIIVVMLTFSILLK